MNKQQFTFLSSNGKTNIHAIICWPKDGKYIGVIQIIHGMYEYIERYLPFIEYLTSKGFIAVGHDHLGHGESINSKEDLGYFGEPNPVEFLIRDIHALRLGTQKQYKNLPYFMCGHSFGSYLLRDYIILYSKGLNGAIVIGTGYVEPCKNLFGINFCKLISSFKGSHHRSRLIKKLSMETGPYLKYDLTKKDIYNSWISRDPEIVKKYNSDEKCNFEFTINGFIGLTESTEYCCDPINIAKIKKDLPILFVSGDCDPVGDNGEGVKKSYEMMKAVGILDVTMKLYENMRHEVLNELNRNEVYEYIYSWLNEKLSLYKKIKLYK